MTHHTKTQLDDRASGYSLQYLKMARLKQLMGDSFVQIALILSLLRTDLSHYLQQYSNYPEVQQALLGQSLGLQVVDIHHDNEFATLPSKFIDDREIIWEELNRLAQSPRILTPDVYQRHIVSAWLVTDDQIASSSTSVATPVTMPTDPTAEVRFMPIKVTLDSISKCKCNTLSVL